MREEKSEKNLSFFGLFSLRPFLRPYKGLIIRALILVFMTSAIGVIYPLFNRYALDHFVAYRTLDTMPAFVLCYVAVLLLEVWGNYRMICNYAKLEMYMDRDLRNAAFSHLQTLSVSYFNQNSVGYIHARVISDVGKIGAMVSWELMDLFWLSSYILFALGVMFLTNWKLALWVAVLLPLASVIIAFFQRRLLRLNRSVRELNSIITADINEGITGVKAIKTLVIEDKMQREFETDTGKMYRKSVHTAHYSALFSATVSLLSSVALAVVLWKGGNLTANAMLEIGTLSVFISYALGMLDPIQNIIRIISQMIMIQVNIERYMKLLDTKPDVFDSEEVIAEYGDAFSPKKENWEPLYGEVEFADVTFRYPDGEELVLEHFDLKVAQGMNVAIVGETGAGKSTLVNLVCRFFEPTKGAVLIDGKDVRRRSIQWLHSNIGYVLQTPYLFSGTVRDNLRYGKPDATDQQMKEAMHLVSADFILEKLEDGLDTQIGEGGASLSTGEKQLISFARALLSDPRILILDEATSSVDTVTEQAIQQAIRTVTRGRTSFMIAHRLSTIVEADLILVVSDGKVIEKGTHRELMGRKGSYYDLYTRQYENMSVDLADI